MSFAGSRRDNMIKHDQIDVCIMNTAQTADPPPTCGYVYAYMKAMFSAVE